MTERERLVELLKTMIHSSKEMTFDDMADFLLDNGVICPPLSVLEIDENGEAFQL